MNIIIFPRNVAEGQQVSNKTKKLICISIYSTNDVPASIGYCDEVLYIQFDDVSGDIPGTILFNNNHARTILDFVEKNNDADLLIVHCDAGLSRSPAVGIAIAEIYNNDKRFYKNYPLYNKFVYNKLMVTANEIKPELEFNHVF